MNERRTYHSAVRTTVERELKLDVNGAFALPELPGSPLPELGKLSVLAGVRDFPTRVKCAGLAWHTLKAAVSEQAAGPVTTE